MSSILFERNLTTEQVHNQYASVFQKLQGYTFITHGRPNVWLGLVCFNVSAQGTLAGDRLRNTRSLLAQLGRTATTAWTLRTSLERYRKAKQQGDEDGMQKEKRDLVLAVGLSAAGYRALGEKTDLFDQPFVDGYAKRRKNQSFFQQAPLYHAMIVLADQETTRLEQARNRWNEYFQGLAEITWEKGQVNKGVVIREPFGFTDNISQPAFFEEDLPARATARWSAASQPNVVLAPELNAAGKDEFGSYMAFLKIQQHIETLDEFTEVVTRAPLLAGLGVDAVQMKAYAIGRTVDGEPLVGAKSRANNNDFDFTEDPKGQTCPFFAHIRKMNPREDNTHMVLRRGVSYIDPQDHTRGTLFQCFQSSLSNGFEFIFHNWALNQHHPQVSAGEDAILRPRPADLLPPNFDMTPELRAQPLTTILFGEYFYFPSIPFFERLELP